MTLRHPLAGRRYPRPPVPYRDVPVGFLMTDADLLVVAELLNPPSWHADAACKHAGVNFFPGPSEKAERAKAICRRCLVRDECLDYALGQPDLAGVWGGRASVSAVDSGSGEPPDGLQLQPFVRERTKSQIALVPPMCSTFAAMALNRLATLQSRSTTTTRGGRMVRSMRRMVSSVLVSE